MKTFGITDVQDLKKNLLEISIDFFNINTISECFIFNEKCDGCHTVVITKQNMLIKESCRIVSKAVSVLTSASETLLSSSCIIIGEEKITLADKIRSLSCDIKVFLLTRHHILSSNNSNRRGICDCNHHKNIKTLTDIFIDVVDIK